MLTLKHLNNSELNSKLKSLAQQERAITRNLVEHIAEVDRRNLYLQMSYPSLYAYLISEIGYSEGSAQRRIDAARLIQRLPEVSAKIQEGSISLNQISKLQSAFREVKRESGKAVSLAQQKDILAKVEHQKARATDLVLAKELNYEVKTIEKKHVQQDESVRIELTLSKDEMALVQRAQEILSHKTGCPRLKETLLEMAKLVIKNAEPKSKASAQAQTKATTTTTVAANSLSSKLDSKVDAPAAANIPSKLFQEKINKTLTVKTKKQIFKQDQCCQYRDKITGRVCGSRYFLEVDHIKPRFAGGAHAIENLRLLCRSHNLLRYRLGA